MTPMPVLEHAAAIFLALLFALAAEHKLRDRRAFAALLREYAPVSAGTAARLAPMLGFVEAALAIALALHTGIACVFAGALLTVYLAAMAVQLARGRQDLDCGCFVARGSQRLRPVLLGRNAVLVALAAFAYPGTAASPGAAALLLAFATAGGSFLLALTAQQLFVNVERLRSGASRS